MIRKDKNGIYRDEKGHFVKGQPGAFSGHKHSEKTKILLASYTGEKNSQYRKSKSEDWKRKTSESHKRDKKLSQYLLNRSEEEKTKQIEKSIETKKLNGTINTSKPEDLLFENLKSTYPNSEILRNYKCDKYPFYCDFYIVEEDLFIELNAHWTHGHHQFNADDPEDIKILKQWEEKAKTSKYFQEAIKTWTIRDVEKQRIAKENNLNYLVLY